MTTPTMAARTNRIGTTIFRITRMSTPASASVEARSAELEVGGIGGLGPGPVVDEAPGAQDVGLALGVAVPAGLDALVAPDHLLHAGLEALVVVVVRVLADLDGAVLAVEEVLQAAHHVPHLALRVEDQ